MDVDLVRWGLRMIVAASSVLTALSLSGSAKFGWKGFKIACAVGVAGVVLGTLALSVKP